MLTEKNIQYYLKLFERNSKKLKQNKYYVWHNKKI